jgi:hypothetical protein
LTKSFSQENSNTHTSNSLVEETMKTIYASTPESAPFPSQAPQAEKRKRSKNIYLLVAGILTIVIIAGALFIPPTQAAIPLTVDYVVGEKMLYTTDISVGIQIQNSTLPSSFMDQATNTNLNVTSQQIIEVVSFDGQYYTLNHTTTMTIAERPFTVSLLEKMNKTGYSTYMIDLGNSGPLTESSTAYQEYLTQLLSQPEVKVGDSITIPFPTTANSTFAVIGNLTLTFGGMKS